MLLMAELVLVESGCEAGPQIQYYEVLEIAVIVPLLGWTIMSLLFSGVAIQQAYS